jgi:TonB family protein
MRLFAYMLLVSAAALAQRSTVAPQVISQNQPEYTEEARRAGVNASILLRFTVTPEGEPRDIEIVRGAGFGLDENAIAAVKTWRFKPGTKAGVATSSTTMVEVNLRLYEPRHADQSVSLNFTLPPQANRPVLVAGKIPPNSPDSDDAIFRVGVTVGPDGVPRDWQVLETTSSKPADTLIRALDGWRFRPAKVGDQPIEVKGVLEIKRGGAVKPGSGLVSRTPMVSIKPTDPLDASLAAPSLLSPAEAATFDNFPRTTTFQWEASPDAASYLLEWDYSDGGVWSAEKDHRPGVAVPAKDTTVSLDFIGAQQGHWRVWPVNASGERGSSPSEWRTFRYVR